MRIFKRQKRAIISHKVQYTIQKKSVSRRGPTKKTTWKSSITIMFKKLFSKQAKVRPKDRRLTEPPAPTHKPPPVPMEVISLYRFMKLYGGQRHPRVDSYETLKKKGYLSEVKYVHPDSTIIFVSHEWSGGNHADPSGTQIRHLAQVLKRLRRGEIDRVESSSREVHSQVRTHRNKLQDQVSAWSEVDQNSE